MTKSPLSPLAFEFKCKCLTNEGKHYAISKGHVIFAFSLGLGSQL